MNSDRFISLYMMPEGWKKAFRAELENELIELLMKADFLSDYRIYDIKEKYGSLRIDDNFAVPVFQDEYYRIIRKYKELSEHTCVICGKQADKKTKWSVPYCDKCIHGARLRKDAAI